jgi:hypothetical protein
MISSIVGGSAGSAFPCCAAAGRRGIPAGWRVSADGRRHRASARTWPLLGCRKPTEAPIRGDPPPDRHRRVETGSLARDFVRAAGQSGSASIAVSTNTGMAQRMDTSSQRVAAAFHQCSSGTGSDRATTAACSSSPCERMQRRGGDYRIHAGSRSGHGAALAPSPARSGLRDRPDRRRRPLTCRPSDPEPRERESHLRPGPHESATAPSRANARDTRRLARTLPADAR